MRKPFVQTRTAVGLMCFALIVFSAMLWYEVNGEPDSTSENIPTEPDQATLYNADKLDESIYHCWGQTGFPPSDMQQLVKKGFLDEIPINPYTNMPMKAIRIGDFPCNGDYTYFSAYLQTNDNGKIRREQKGFWLIVYGSKPHNDSLAWSTETFGEEIANRIIYQSANIFFDVNTGSGPSKQYQSPESVLAENGYHF